MLGAAVMECCSIAMFLMNPPYIFGASVRGSLHLKGGLPCQDAHRFDIIRGDKGLIAVADGLGSAQRSDLGAAIAVNAAIDKAKMLLLHNDNPHDLADIPLLMLRAAREALEQSSCNDGFALSSLATTLIAVVFSGDSVYAAQIGDGAVVALIRGELKALSSVSDSDYASEYANEVVPITDDDWEQGIVSSSALSSVQSLAVFTDGCQRASLVKIENRYEPFDRFFYPVFSFASSIKDRISAEEELKLFLESPKMSEFSEDDKTLVLSILRGADYE